MTETTVRADRHNGIAVLTIDHPPVNAMALPVRAALLEAVIAADEDDQVAAIVIRGGGRHFVAGADIREFGAEPRAPLLNDVLLRLEASIQAGDRGAARLRLGRRSRAGARLPLPHCLVRCVLRTARNPPGPVAGIGRYAASAAARRSPRCLVADAERRADRVVRVPSNWGSSIAWRAAPTCSPRPCGTPREIAASGSGPRRLREQPIMQALPDAAFVAEQRALAMRKFPGVLSIDAIIECVQAAATRDFDSALALSRRRFEECRCSDASRALRHLFFAERELAATVKRGRSRASGCSAPAPWARPSRSVWRPRDWRWCWWTPGRRLCRPAWIGCAAPSPPRSRRDVSIPPPPPRHRARSRGRQHRCARERGSGDRGRVRKPGGQARGVRIAREGLPCRGGARLQHLDPGHRCHRGGVRPIARRGRDAFFQPCQHHAAGRDRARDRYGTRCHRHGAGADGAHGQTRRGGGELLRVRRQSDAVRLRPREPVDAARGRRSGADRRGAGEVRHGDGPQRRGRPRRPRRRLSGAPRTQGSSR